MAPKGKGDSVNWLIRSLDVICELTPSSGAVFVNDLDNKTTKEKMLRQLISWAKTIPHFSDLKVDDQVRIHTKRPNELHSRFCASLPSLPLHHCTRWQGWYISGTLRKLFPNLTACSLHFVC